MRLTLTLLALFGGGFLLVEGMSLFSYGWRTADFNPMPPGNDNIVFCVIALPIMALGFGLILLGTIPMVFRIFRKEDRGATTPKSVVSGTADRESNSEFDIECLNCGRPIRCSFADIDAGVSCTHCKAVVSFDDLEWGDETATSNST